MAIYKEVFPAVQHKLLLKAVSILVSFHAKALLCLFTHKDLFIFFNNAPLITHLFVNEKHDPALISGTRIFCIFCIISSISFCLFQRGFN